MKLPAIKKLVHDYTIEQLTFANDAILTGDPLSITVGGEDEGEQLTHLYAALWVKKHMVDNETDVATSLRAYTAMVRNSFK